MGEFRDVIRRLRLGHGVRDIYPCLEGWINASNTLPDLKIGGQILLKVRRKSLTALATSLSLRFDPAEWIARCSPFGRELGVGAREDKQPAGAQTVQQEERSFYDGVASLIRIRPQFSGHLDVCMGKMIPLPHIDPSLAFFGHILLCQRTIA